MTDETRAELRAGIEDLVRKAELLPNDPYAPGYSDHRSNGRQAIVEVWLASTPINLPPLTTAQQLALSVLLGESVPLSVLLSACEDAGLFPDGVMSAVAERARAEGYEKGKQDGNPLTALAKAFAAPAAALGHMVNELQAAGITPSQMRTLTLEDLRTLRSDGDRTDPK